jgi:hypothetical protein
VASAGASIPGACKDWNETAAAYRFLGNEGVGCDDVLAAHWDASQKRISQHSVVLCLQDATELDYNGQQIQGLGPLSYEAQRGLYLRTRSYRDIPARAARGHQHLDVGQGVQGRGRPQGRAAGEQALD